jgi:hypothetical protein
MNNMPNFDKVDIPNKNQNEEAMADVYATSTGRIRRE